MNRFLFLILSIGMLTVGLCGCDSSTINDSSSISLPTEYSDTREYFNVPIIVKAYGDNAETAVNLAFERVAELESIFSNNIEDSEVEYINAHAYNMPVEISSDMQIVLEKSIYYGELTDGALDVTIGNLIDAWGIGTDNAAVPSDDVISAYIGLHDYENVSLEDSTVAFLSDTVQLNFGAISKGYIGDEMKKVLMDNGITSATLNLGGNVSTIGTKPSGKLWTVAITDPKDTSNYLGTIQVDDKSVVTSGDYERYFIQDGKKYHHILDTSTGYPTDNGISSVTIIGDDGIDCDALSTACFVMGLDSALELIESLPDYDAIIALSDGTIYTTSNVSEYCFSEMS